MPDTANDYIYVFGGLLVIAVLTGIWTRSGGRPLKNLRFTLHKLAVLAMMGIAVMVCIRQTMGLSSPAFLTLASLLLISLITGALLSFDKFAVPWLKSVHRFSSYMIPASMALILFL